MWYGKYYEDVLLDIKKMRFPSDRQSQGPSLFWSYDYSGEGKSRDSTIANNPLSLLDDLTTSENVEMLPDPITHVIGVTFDKSEAETAERSQSPSSVSKSRAWKEEDTERDLHTTRTVGPGNNQGLDMSTEPNTTREKVDSYSKEKNKNTLASITNKYTKLKGRDTSKTGPSNEVPIRGKDYSNKNDTSSPGRMGNSTLGGTSASNKFSLNLAAVRRVSGQVKTNQPLSGRDKDTLEAGNMSSTLYSERRKNIGTPSSALNKLGTKPTKYAQERKLYGREDSLRDESNPSIMSNSKRKSDVSSTVATRGKK